MSTGPHCTWSPGYPSRVHNGHSDTGYLPLQLLQPLVSRTKVQSAAGIIMMIRCKQVMCQDYDNPSAGLCAELVGSDARRIGNSLNCTLSLHI